MGKHNLRRIVNLQVKGRQETFIKRMEKSIAKSVTGIPATEQNQGKDSPLPKHQQVSKRERYAFNERNVQWLNDSLKRDLEQLEQLKYRKLK